jgi:hypothetical protein
VELLPDTACVSESVPFKRVSGTTVRALVALIPWALLFAFIVANSTVVGEPTDWAEVATVSIFGLIPVILALGVVVGLPALRSRCRGWTGVFMSWAGAFCGLLTAAWALGPFM